MILVGRELRNGSALLLIIETAGLLRAKAAVLLLPERTLLLVLLIQLPGWSADIGTHQCVGRIGSLQKYVGLVHLRVVNELPFVVGLLLVVEPDGRVLTLAGHTHD